MTKQKRRGTSLETDNGDIDARLGKLNHDLIERVKELNCLYGISRIVERRDVSLDEILSGVVDLIPPAWQYPEVTCAGIKLRRRVFKTSNFEGTKWIQSEPIRVNGKKVGSIEVYYLEEKPWAYEGPFLKEERDLIHGIAERLGHIIESKIAEDSLRTMYAREKRLYRKLQAEMQSRIDLTRQLVHELKTPLTSLIATSQLLVEETRGTRLERLAEYVWNGASGLNLRVEDLHDVIRGEFGRIKLELKSVDIRQLLLSLVQETKPLSQQHGVPIDFETDEPLPKVTADSARVRQVVLNLINNAFKYAAEGGRIDIRARHASDSTVVIEVRDYGGGIPLDEQRWIFKPGYQVSRRGERQSGLGIGLALCKMLVELQGGRIWFESVAGKGSCFFFSLRTGDSVQSKAGQA